MAGFSVLLNYILYEDVVFYIGLAPLSEHGVHENNTLRALPRGQIAAHDEASVAPFHYRLHNGV